MKDNRQSYRLNWWLFAERRPELTRLKAAQDRVQVCSAKATTHLCFVIVNSEVVLTNATNVILDARVKTFALLQSRVHEAWARFQGSSMKDDLTYTSSSCLEPFPFPFESRDENALESAGTDLLPFSPNSWSATMRV